MTTETLTPICAFDIGPEGPAVVQEPWPATHGPRAFRWLHLDGAAAQTRSWVEAHLPEIPAAALLQAETRPRCEVEGDGIILNLRGVNMNPGSLAEDMVSLRLWVTPSLIVSLRFRKVFAVDDLRASVEAGNAPHSVGGLLTRLAKGLTDRIEAVSLRMEGQVDTLEESEGDGDLAPLRRAVIRLRRYVGPQREALEDLVQADDSIVEGLQQARLREVANRTARIVEELDATRDRLIALQDHKDALAQARLTRNNYLLAIVAAVFLPLGFLTGLFGVNLGGMPGANSPLGFAVLCLGLALIGAGLMWFFKSRRWF